MAADVVINPTHDRMGNAGKLGAKRRLLSRALEYRNRVYVSCSNWEVCGDSKRGGIQNVTDTLHTIYTSGTPVSGAQIADGSFGFAYRSWSLSL